MVLTVEPGIYIASDSDVPEQYKGIGVRIEDDVVVTATGVDILTADVPKTVKDIEALMQSANKENTLENTVESTVESTVKSTAESKKENTKEGSKA